MTKKLTGVHNGAIVTGLRSFTDASGAPAVVSYGAYKFAFDTVGEVTCFLLRPVFGSRVENKIAVEHCKAAYLRERDTVVSVEWLKANADLYKETGR